MSVTSPLSSRFGQSISGLPPPPPPTASPFARSAQLPLADVFQRTFRCGRHGNRPPWLRKLFFCADLCRRVSCAHRHQTRARRKQQRSEQLDRENASVPEAAGSVRRPEPNWWNIWRRQSFPANSDPNRSVGETKAVTEPRLSQQAC